MKFPKEVLIRRKQRLNTLHVCSKKIKDTRVAANEVGGSTCMGLGMGCKYWLPRSPLMCPASPTAVMPPRSEYTMYACKNDDPPTRLTRPYTFLDHFISGVSHVRLRSMHREPDVLFEM